MQWRLTLEDFGSNIHHIDDVNNIVADGISILPSTPSDKYNPCTRKAQCHANQLFTIGTVGKNEDCFPLN